MREFYELTLNEVGEENIEFEVRMVPDILILSLDNWSYKSYHF